MRYTQGDIRQVMGISRDMLRLYERRGIISPEIDPNNRYRYYDDWQINLLWECKRHQAMGFSLTEVKQILQEDDLPTLTRRLEERTGRLYRELRYAQMVADECRACRERLGSVPDMMGSFLVEPSEEGVFVPEREVHDLMLESAGSEAMGFVNRNQALARPCSLFPDVAEGRYFWGFAMPRATYEELGGPVGGHDHVPLEAGDALVGHFDAGERGGFGLGLFAPLVEEAERRHLTTKGHLYGLLLARTHEDDGYHRYVKAVLPLA